MWPHQSSLREILRCVCYEKMEGSRASCAASRGAFGFLCSPRLANFQERGAPALSARCCFPNRPSTAPMAGPRMLPVTVLRLRGEGAPPGSHLFWGRRDQMCWVTARFPEMTSAPGGPAPLMRARHRQRPPVRTADVPAPASKPRMPLITCGKLSPTISFAYASLFQTPRKEFIFSAAACLEWIKRL